MKCLLILVDDDCNYFARVVDQPAGYENYRGSFANHIWGLPENIGIVAMVEGYSPTRGVNIDFNPELNNVYVEEIQQVDELTLPLPSMEFEPKPGDRIMTESGEVVGEIEDGGKIETDVERQESPKTE